MSLSKVLLTKGFTASWLSVKKVVALQFFRYPPSSLCIFGFFFTPSPLEYGRLFEFAEHFTQHSCHFTYRGISLHRLQGGRHDVDATHGGFLQVLQTRLNLGVIA